MNSLCARKDYTAHSTNCNSEKKQEQIHSVELLRELDKERKELSETIQALSRMKLLWSVVTILASSSFSMLPFPLNLSAPAISFSVRAFCRLKKGYSQGFAFTLPQLHAYMI